MPTASLLAQLETDDYSGSEQYRGDRAYFAEALEGREPALFTRRRPAGLRRTARHRLTLERTLLDAIRDRGESPFLFLSAAVALYLARFSTGTPRTTSSFWWIRARYSATAAERNRKGDSPRSRIASSSVRSSVSLWRAVRRSPAGR
ncbi:hypothetical protein Q4R51_21000, partial [Morganella morganii]